LSWLLYHAGLTNANSPWYLFWSGIGADWTRILAVGGLFKLWQQRERHHAELTDLHERHHRERLRHERH
jgi:hypothetical protein